MWHLACRIAMGFLLVWVFSFTQGFVCLEEGKKKKKNAFLREMML